MLSEAKSVLLSVALWFVANPARIVVLILAVGFLTILTLALVLPETSAVAISATSGSP